MEAGSGRHYTAVTWLGCGNGRGHGKDPSRSAQGHWNHREASAHAVRRVGSDGQVYRGKGRAQERQVEEWKEKKGCWAQLDVEFM